MAGLKISILLLLASAIIGVSSLRCFPCDPDDPATCDASKALSCTAGIGKDVCGCCDVCSQALGENCGGPWNSTGVCGNNLKCLKQPLQNNYVDSFNLEGKCVLEIPEFDSNWFNGFDLTGFGGIDFSGFGDSVFTLINGVTFLNGIEIVEGKDCYTACTGTYWPVCGSDGISYPNECALLNLQCVNPDLKVAQNAACGVIPSVDPVFCHKAMCTREYRPVCGSDGKTYSNKCELNNAKCDDKALRMVHNSLCVKIVITTCKNLFCTKEYEPICGSDGETYGNECLFNKAKCTDKTLIIVTRSECESTTTTTSTYFKITINNGFDLSGFSGLLLSGFSGYSFTFENGLTLLNGHNFGGSECYTACTLIYMPVCGSDGNSYPNDCALQNAKCDNYNLYRRYNGKCEDVQYPEGTTCIMAKCKGNLDDSFKVCGSDGKIYASFCNFLNAKCKNDFLELADMGSCVGIVGPIECKSPCPLNYEPVCGTDGETYRNDCFLKNAICDDIFLIKKGDGPCDDCKSKICTDKYFTICGSDGRTYGSECLFKNAQCDNFSLQRKHNGECAEVIPFCVKRMCLKYYQPVCGSDGQTYSSECYLNNAKCENNLLKLSYTGHCEIIWRYDLRCGHAHNYPLSSGKPAQCNPNSESAYCCSASGWCGHTPFHCDCKDCVNYKKINLDSLLLSAVVQLQGTCGHANDCRTTLQTLEQFVGLQKEHIRLLNHNEELVSKRVLELEQQARDASRKLNDLVAYSFECLPPYIFFESTKECLYFHTDLVTYYEAETRCLIQGLGLADIAIPANFEVLSKYMNENGFGNTPETQPFIGAKYLSEGNYSWKNDTAIKTDTWQEKPDQFTGYCVVYCPTCLSSSPLRADTTTACTAERPYICEK